MVRISKQSERRQRAPRKLRPSFAKKTGPKNSPFKEHPNAIEGDVAKMAFIPKIK
jgi:hypothetical protein